MFRMYSIRKWLYKPKKNDPSLLAQFFYADEDLNVIATELDSFDGRKDPERCTALVNQLRACQDKVLNNIQVIMEDAIPNQRANRDFRVKFPDDVVHENLSGQLWFGAECLAAGSSIMNHEIESASMRPLARALTRTLDNLRSMIRDQCLRNSSQYTEKIKDALTMFDQLFAEFELSYVSAMVPVKSMREYDAMQDVIVLFSETVHRALKNNLISQEMIDDYDPALMFTIPRLAIVCGLLIYGEGPLNPDNDSEALTEMFRPFQTLLFKIRQLLLTLSEEELVMLERALCSQHDAEPGQPRRDAKDGDVKQKHSVEEDDSDAFSGRMSQSTSANTIMGNPDYVLDGNDTWPIKHQDSRDSGICDQRAVSHESLPPSDLTLATLSSGGESTEEKCSSVCDVRLVPQHTDYKSEGARFSPDCNRISPIEELMSESMSSKCSGSVSLGDDLEEENDLNPVISDADDADTKLEIEYSAGNDNERSSEITGHEIVVESDQVLMPVLDLHGACSDRESHGACLDLRDSNLLQVEDAGSSACGSTNTSPSKSIYSEVASESDTYFDASEVPATASDDLDTSLHQRNHNMEDNVPEMKCDNTCGDTSAARSDARSQNEAALNQAPSPLRMNVNHFENPEPSDKTCTGVMPKLKSSKSHRGLLRSSKESFYRRRVRDLVGHREDRYRPSGVKFTESVSSSCSTCASDSDLDHESCDSSDTSSYNSDCHDDEEIALAIQAAEVASRNEARSRFRSSSDLIHRLFVCVSGVADQLQTNYASDLRNILRSVFEIHSSEPITHSDQPRKGPPASIRRGPITSMEPPMWVPDSDSLLCTSCKMPFTLVRRRHHCRNCGKIFCSRCSPNLVPLPHFGHTKPVRVCNRCFMFQVTPFTVNATS
ncbi:lateral signaling target protein 2 homolog isoform X2 [Lineus longissimus]|uniref:lateral signaling target protein 2 homolog isoform X2 n=1 Tax=Lineus longissimus TaxID=88925 RepID=UPI002B4C3646